MPHIFYFAWVTSAAVAFNPLSHAVEDEDVFELSIEQLEGESAAATVTLRNPSVGLLSPGRKQWAWISCNIGAGVVPLFLGRLVALPQDFGGLEVTLEFLAEPEDIGAAKAALAATLRTLPYYDPVWLTEEARADADAVLEARAADWHVNPVTHVVSISDCMTGEDGTLSFTAADILGPDIGVNVIETPLRSVTVQAEARWVQRATGEIDISKPLCDAFTAAGTPHPHVISSFTGDGLFLDWPEEDDDIGAGWRFGWPDITEADGAAFPATRMAVVLDHITAPPASAEPKSAAGIPSVSVNTGGGYYLSIPGGGANGAAAPVTLWLRHYAFWPRLKTRYDANRTYTETLEFTLTAGAQALHVEPGAETTETITLATTALTDAIDTGGALPLGDLRRNSWFNTTRGLSSLRFLIARAAARLVRRARAVEVSVTVPLALGVAATTRKSMTVAAPQLPGGTATGKITGTRISVAGGVATVDISMACMVGAGGTVVSAIGDPVYVAAGYVQQGYQLYEGSATMALAGLVTHGAVVPNAADDGLDFFNPTAAMMVQNITVLNGPAVQKAAMSQRFVDATTAVDALTAVKTEIQLTMRPVSGQSFEAHYPVVVSELALPRGIDMEAV